MRVALAVVLGLLFGATGATFAHATVSPIIDSAGDVLSWEGAALLSQLPWVSESVTQALTAVIAVIALPALLASISEALRGGRPARTSATLVLVVTGLAGLAAPSGSAGPYLLCSLALAAVMAAWPSRWAAMPVGFLCASVTAMWLCDLLDEAHWLRPAATSLTEATSAPGLWVAALGAVSGAMLVCATLRTLRN